MKRSNACSDGHCMDGLGASFARSSQPRIGAAASLNSFRLSRRIASRWPSIRPSRNARVLVSAPGIHSARGILSSIKRLTTWRRYTTSHSESRWTGSQNSPQPSCGLQLRLRFFARFGEAVEATSVEYVSDDLKHVHIIVECARSLPDRFMKLMS